MHTQKHQTHPGIELQALFALEIPFKYVKKRVIELASELQDGATLANDCRHGLTKYIFNFFNN